MSCLSPTFRQLPLPSCYHRWWNYDNLLPVTVIETVTNFIPVTNIEAVANLLHYQHWASYQSPYHFPPCYHHWGSYQSPHCHQHWASYHSPLCNHHWVTTLLPVTSQLPPSPHASQQVWQPRKPHRDLPTLYTYMTRAWDPIYWQLLVNLPSRAAKTWPSCHYRLQQHQVNLAAMMPSPWLSARLGYLHC